MIIYQLFIVYNKIDKIDLRIPINQKRKNEKPLIVSMIVSYCKIEL